MEVLYLLNQKMVGLRSNLKSKNKRRTDSNNFISIIDLNFLSPNILRSPPKRKKRWPSLSRQEAVSASEKE